MGSFLVICARKHTLLRKLNQRGEHIGLAGEVAVKRRFGHATLAARLS